MPKMPKPVLIGADGKAVSTKTPAQEECITLLQDMLGDAMEGKIHALVVVACGDGDFGTAMAGSDAPRLHLGLGMAQQLILDRVRK